MNRKVDISHKTVLFIAAFLIFLWIIYLILDIILLFFVAFILMSALSPLVDRLVKWRVPRALAALLVLFSFIALIVGLLTISFTPLIRETQSLSEALIRVVNSLVSKNIIDQSTLQNQVSRVSSQAFTFTLIIVQNLVAFASLIVITFYLLLDKEKLEGLIASFFIGKQERVRKLFDRIEEMLGAWLRGQLLLSALIGIIVYLGLTALGISYALPLAMLAGIFELVPVIGPIISAIPAILLALTVSPIFALLIAGFYLVVQQTEGHVVVPQVMKRVVGLNPILIILAISIGGRLLGVGGALLAVPIAVVIQIILAEILNDDSLLSSP